MKFCVFFLFLVVNVGAAPTFEGEYNDYSDKEEEPYESYDQELNIDDTYISSESSGSKEELDKKLLSNFYNGQLQHKISKDLIVSLFVGECIQNRHKTSVLSKVQQQFKIAIKSFIFEDEQLPTHDSTKTQQFKNELKSMILDVCKESPSDTPGTLNTEEDLSSNPETVTEKEIFSSAAEYVTTATEATSIEEDSTASRKYNYSKSNLFPELMGLIDTASSEESQEQNDSPPSFMQQLVNIFKSSYAEEDHALEDYILQELMNRMQSQTKSDDKISRLIEDEVHFIYKAIEAERRRENSKYGPMTNKIAIEDYTNTHYFQDWSGRLTKYQRDFQTEFNKVILKYFQSQEILK